jgi:hypothetical protein
MYDFVSEDAQGNFYVMPLSTSAISEVYYYIYAENGWGTSVYSTQATLRVVCIATSTTISQTGYPNEFSVV